MQYTLRKVPSAVDKAIRAQARGEGKSINEVAVRVLVQALGLVGESIERRDLSDIAGTWTKDMATEAALAAQDQIDGEP